MANFGRKTKSTETNRPEELTHELVLTVELNDGSQRIVGRISLFDNNKLHQKIIASSDERLQELLSKCTAQVIEYGADRKESDVADW